MNFSNYGKLVSCYEATIYNKMGVIVHLNYLTNNTDKYEIINGTQYIEANLSMDSSDKPYYDVNTYIHSALSKVDVPMCYNAKSDRLSALSVFNNMIENSIRKDNNKEIKLKSVITYDNCTKKDEDTFTVSINKEKICFDIVVDKENKVYMDDHSIDIANENSDKPIVIEHYDIYQDTVVLVRLNLDDGKMQIDNMDFSDPENITTTSVENMFKPHITVCDDLVNLNYNPTKIITYDKNGDPDTYLDIKYDEFGIAQYDSNGDIRYEKFYNDKSGDIPEEQLTYEYVDSIVSLHPLYIDIMDNSNMYSDNLWVFEQLVLSEEELSFYTYEIRELSDDEVEELRKVLEEASEEEPILEFIDIEDFWNPVKANSTVVMSDITWTNNTELFADGPNYNNQINDFEKGYNKSILMGLVESYILPITSNLDHQDRKDEYKGKDISITNILGTMEKTGIAIIEKTDKDDLYRFKLEIKFTKYIKPKTIYLVNEFDVINNKFIFHDAHIEED